MPTLRTIPADLSHPEHQAELVRLLDLYARDPMGGAKPLSDEVRRLLPVRLREHPSCHAFLAYLDEEAVGLAICFLGFSTFRAQPLLNIHDIAAAPQARGLGVGKALLAAVEARARDLGCCKLTLEVRDDNVTARGLYQRFGFDPGAAGTTAMSFWTKEL